MQLIVSDHSRNVVLDILSGRPLCVACDRTYTWDGFDLWEISGAQTSPTGPSDNIVRGVLVNICCLLAARLDNFKHGVDLKSVVRILQGTFSIYDNLGEMCWIDITTEEFRGIVIKILGRVGYETFSMPMP